MPSLDETLDTFFTEGSSAPQATGTTPEAGTDTAAGDNPDAGPDGQDGDGNSFEDSDLSAEELEELGIDDAEDADAEDDTDDEDGDEDGEDEEDDDGPAELSDEATYVVNGEELTGKELREGFLRQADYTRKTQELAQERKQLEGQITEKDTEIERLSGVESGLNDFVEHLDTDPADAVAGLVLNNTNGVEETTTTLMKALRTAADRGSLHPQVVEQLGVNDPNSVVAQATGLYDQNAEARKLRAENERLRNGGDKPAEGTGSSGDKATDAPADDHESRRAAAKANFEAAWGELKTEAGLSFDTAEAEQAAQRELVQYAKDNGVTNLKVAHKAMTADKAAKTPAGDDEAKTQRRETARSKAKKASASTKRGAKGASSPPASLDDAVESAISHATSKRT